MDARTDRELRKVTANVPIHLQRGIVREEVDTTQEDMVRDILASGKLTGRHEQRLRTMLANGAFRRSETVVDEKIVKELDRYHSAMIQKLKAQGKLGDPNTDKFLQERARKLKAMKSRT